MSPTARITIASNNDSATVRARSDARAMVTLDASTSVHATAFSWTLYQLRPATALVDLSLPLPQPAAFNVSLAPGEYLASLTTSGPLGSASTQRLLAVQRNSPPIAAAGGPYTCAVGAQVTVSAGRSSDPDGDALTFRWALSLAATAPGAAPLAEATGLVANFTPPYIGLYRLTLEVDDVRGGVSVTAAELTALPASMLSPALPSTALPAPAQALAPPLLAPVLPAPVTTTVAAMPSPAVGGAPSPKPGAALPHALSAPAASPPQPPAPISVPPNAQLTTTPQCLFDKTTNVGVQAYDITAMPALTNLLAWANQQWRSCSSGPVKPLGVTLAAYLAANPAAGAAGSAAAAAAAVAASSIGGPSAVIAAPPTYVPTAEGARPAHVTLNATGSAGTLVRPILLYNWVVRQLPSGTVVAAVSGKTAVVTLAASVYTAYLTCTDSAGGVGSATKVFAVWPTPVTAAAIAAPSPLVAVTDGDSTVVSCLDAMHTRGQAAAACRHTQKAAHPRDGRTHCQRAPPARHMCSCHPGRSPCLPMAPCQRRGAT